MSEPIEEPQEGEPGEAEESQFQGPENPQEPADDGEAEHGEESEESGFDVTVTTPEPQGMSEKELERSLKALEKGATGWRTKVETIMGAEAAMLLPCPLCEPIIPGFVMQMDEDRKTAVRAFIGDRPVAEYRPDPYSQRCVTCDGLGEVETGSLVPAKAVLPCRDCNGAGAVGERFAGLISTTATPVSDAPPNGAPPAGLDADDFAAVERLRAKRIVVIVPEPAPL